MITWLTRMSFLDSAADMEDDLLAQTAEASHRMVHQMMYGEAFDKKELIVASHPSLRMWDGFEVALMAYCASLCVDLNRRGIAAGIHLNLVQIIKSLRVNEPAEFDRPAWIEDTDVLRSHRSNMARRWPSTYGSTWAKTPELMPYLWPFTDEDGSYALYLSRADKELLASGERVLPKSILNRVENA